MAQHDHCSGGGEAPPEMRFQEEQHLRPKTDGRVECRWSMLRYNFVEASSMNTSTRYREISVDQQVRCEEAEEKGSCQMEEDCSLQPKRSTNPQVKLEEWQWNCFHGVNMREVHVIDRPRSVVWMTRMEGTNFKKSGGEQGGHEKYSKEESYRKPQCLSEGMARACFCGTEQPLYGFEVGPAGAERNAVSWAINRRTQRRVETIVGCRSRADG